MVCSSLNSKEYRLLADTYIIGQDNRLRNETLGIECNSLVETVSPMGLECIDRNFGFNFCIFETENSCPPSFQPLSFVVNLHKKYTSNQTSTTHRTQNGDWLRVKLTLLFHHYRRVLFPKV